MANDAVSIGRKRSRGLLAAGLLVAAGLASSGRAQAQNLVVNPNFTNGFAGYVDVCCNVTTMQNGNGGAVAVLPGGSTFSQVIATSASTMYLVSFVASFTGPGNYTASFGNFTFHEDSTMPGTFSFLAPGEVNDTVLTFATTGDSNTEYLTNLDVEAAPAPTPGAGIVSFCAVFALFAARNWRRVSAARG